MEIRSGFSIIELTVVIGLLGILALAMSSIMLTTIVSSNRVRTLTKIKQAGDYALTQLQSLIRNASSVSACDSQAATTTLVNPGGGETTILLESDADGNPRIASNSGYYLTPGDLKISGFTLSCQPDDTSPVLINVAFDLESVAGSTKAIEAPKLHFTAAAQLRND